MMYIASIIGEAVRGDTICEGRSIYSRSRTTFICDNFRCGMGGNHSKPKRVAVLGGGPAGLTAAYCLLKSGSDVRVDVFESSNRFGGSVLSGSNGKFIFDLGPNSMATKHAAVADLIYNQLNLGEKIEPREGSRHIFLVKDGKPVSLPMSFKGLLNSPLLSFPAKLRLLLEPLVPRLPEPQADQESVRAFFRRRFGKAVSETLVDPMMAGIYSASPQNLSMKHALARIWTVEREKRSITWGLLRGGFRQAVDPLYPDFPRKDLQKSFNFSGGMQTLPDALESEIRLRPKATRRLRSKYTVRELNRDENGKWQVNGRGSYDAVISTIPAHGLASVSSNIRTVRKTFSRLGRYIPYSPVSVMVFEYDRAHVPQNIDGFGALVSSREGLNILGVNFSSNGFPKRYPDKDRVVWTVFAGGGRRPEVVLQNKNVVTELCMKEVESVFGVTGRPTLVGMKNWYAGIPLYKPGYDKVTRAIRRLENSAEAEGLVLGGNYNGGVGLPDTLLSGMQCADRIVTYLNKVK